MKKKNNNNNKKHNRGNKRKEGDIHLSSFAKQDEFISSQMLSMYIPGWAIIQVVRSRRAASWC